MRYKRQPPAYVQNLCHALLEGLKTALGEKLYGVYLFGAVAFPETKHTSDIDFHVILKGALTKQEHATLVQLHAKLAREYPPLGDGMDGHYLLLEDARGIAQPQSQLASYNVDDAWALHRAHIRAGRCILLHGPDPRSIYPAASWVELEADLEDQLQYVKEHLVVYPAYCILNLCRLMYSFGQREVVISKAAAGEWAWEQFPQWRVLIETAQRFYAGQANAEEEDLLKFEVKAFYRFAYDRIRK